jgi:hypothetical protein
MAKVKVRELKDFTGGLNFRADQFQLADNESPDMLNVEIDPRGGVFSRGAMRRINNTAVSGTWVPQSLFPFYGATPRIMLSTETRVYQSSGGNFSLLEYSSGNPIVSTSVHGASFASWGTKLYVATGTAGSGSYVWDTASTYATALTASGVAPNAWQTTPTTSERKMPTAELLHVHANKMFAANVRVDGVDYPNRLYWSLENAPENWNEDDYIEINAGGNRITGLATVAGQLIIFKPNAIFALFGYDSDNFQVVEVSSNLGVDTPHNIAVSDKGVYFFSNPEGVYYYNGSSISDIFENLRPIIELEYISVNVEDAFHLSWIGQRLWVSAPYSRTDAVANSTVNFVYDPTIGARGSWMQFSTADGKGLTAGCNWHNGSNVEFRLLTHPTLPYVLQVDMYSADFDNISGADVSYTSKYRTKWFDAGFYSQRKMFRRPEFVIKQSAVNQTIGVKVYHDFDEADGNERRTFNLTQSPTASGMVWGSSNWGDNWSTGAISSLLITGNNLGLAQTVQLEFNGPLGQLWGINSIGYKYQSRQFKG